MKTFFLFFGFLFLVVPAQAKSVSVDDILEKHKQTLPQIFEESLVSFLINHHNGKEDTPRKILIKRKKSKQTQSDKTLIWILEPAELQGLKVLTIHEDGKESKQWIYLPSLKKIQRMTASGQNKNFAGSEFTYKDLLPFDYSSYSFAILSQNPNQDYKIQATPKNTQQSLEKKLILFIDSQNYHLKRIDFYDQNDTLTKTAIFDNYKEVASGKHRPFQITIKNQTTNRQSAFLIVSTNTKKKLHDSEFSLRALKR